MESMIVNESQEIKQEEHETEDKALKGDIVVAGESVPTTDTTLTTTAAEVTPANNEFSYLQRNEFTSEIFKIEVCNLGYFGIGEFRKLLKVKLKLDVTKIKSPNCKEFAYVCFRNEEEKARGLQILNGYKWKSKVLRAFTAKANADPLMKRRNDEDQQKQLNNSPGGNSKLKKQRTSAEATCPLASLSYEEQLTQKTTNMEALLKKFQNDLKRINANAKIALNNFKFDGVLPSPQIDGYRNKNEFTVGKNSAGEIVVGFRLGSYVDGSVEVAEVSSLPHLPDAAKWAAESFQTFVRSSKFEPFSPENNTGHIRQVMVRTSLHTGEIMLVAGIYSSNLNESEVQELKENLKNFYEIKEENSKFKCSSLYYQDVKHREAGQVISPIEHLSGSTHITDTINNLQFRISPLAFFQINTKGADVLYQKAIELAAPQSHTTVLDICCGTGTIALAFAKHCKQVMGVEIIPDAIKDAEINARTNKIENCKFYTGNSDDYIQSMVREIVYDVAPGTPLDLVAILDPPRAGLHNRSITAIRAATSLNRLIYISCDPLRAQRNWIELGRPESKHYKGKPFFPKTAIAVDMFPHTTHTELIILFERETVDSIPVSPNNNGSQCEIVQKNVQENVAVEPPSSNTSEPIDTNLQEKSNETLS